MNENKLSTLHLSDNSIAYDYIYHYANVEEFFTADYHDFNNYEPLIDDIFATPHAPRQELIEILIEQNTHFACGDNTMRNIHLLSDQHALAVVTGQQTGLFGGPLYTLYKALTTCKLAESLSDRFQYPIVPVFYLVSEDHDFEEIRWLGYINKINSFKKIYYTPSLVESRKPISEIILDKNIDFLFEELETDTSSSEFKNEILAILQSSYRPDVGIHVAFARWYTHLLRDFGMIFLDASDSRIKRLVLPIFKRELIEDASIPEMLKANKQLSARGYPLQLAVNPKRPHVFIINHGRHSLERENHNFRCLYNNRIYSPQELLENPHLLSPKAALRPIVQNYLLPVLSYVAGPAEIAYWAQLKEVHQAFEIPMPIVVPRAAFTIIEKRIKRYIDRLGISIEELYFDRSAVLQKTIYHSLPSRLTQSLMNIKNFISQEWSKVSQNLIAIDPTLISPAKKTEEHILKILRQFENKLTKTLERREEITVEHVRVIWENLFPEGKLQERQLNITPFLFKYHWSFINTIFEAIDLSNLQHRTLMIE